MNGDAPVSDTVSARKFVLVGPQGLERGRWFTNEEAESVLEVKVRNGSIRLVSGAGGDARIELKNVGAKNAVSATIEVSEAGTARLAFVDGGKIHRFQVGLQRSGETQLVMRDERDYPRVELSAGKRRGEWFQFLDLRSPGGRPSVTVSCKDSAFARCQLLGPAKPNVRVADLPRIVLETREAAVPTLAAFGAAGDEVWRASKR